MKYLKKELIKRFESDQKLSFSYVKLKELKNIYRENTLWLRSIINKIGWSSQDLVGIVGEQAVWLITQHSSDIRFQEQCLELIEYLPQTKERKQYAAYLTDKILVKKKRRQSYGTQFCKRNDGKLEPRAIKDLKNLEK